MFYKFVALKIPKPTPSFWLKFYFFISLWQPQIQSYDSVCVILGNESCDLDSAVCALVFAFFLEHKKKFSSVHLPVLNIAKEDYCLKTEVVYFLKRFVYTVMFIIFKSMLGIGNAKLCIPFHVDSIFHQTTSFSGRF